VAKLSKQRIECINTHESNFKQTAGLIDASFVENIHSQGLNKCACINTHESNFKQTAGLMDASFVAKHSQPRIE
jgi:hypothetical protein